MPLDSLSYAPLAPNPAPRRSPWLLVAGVGVLIVLVAGGLALFLKRGGVNQNEPTPTNQPTAEEIQQAKVNLEQSHNTERIQNLTAIHLMLTAYKEEHSQYPDSLAQLADIKRFAPDAAKAINEAKLENGQSAYTYTKSGASYQVCANQMGSEPKCEGPK